MRITNIETLDYLHDAIVRYISFDMSADGSKQLVIEAECDANCGYEEWAGKVVSVTLSNVILASAIFWGHVAGEDIVQSLIEGVSAATRQRVTQLSDLGISPPMTLLTVTLQSGSEIEIACDGVDVIVIV